MKKLGVVLMCTCLSWVAALAQNTYTLTGEERERLTEFEILEDQQYSFDQILSDTSLPFRPAGVFRADQCERYWVRIRLYNPRAYMEAYMLRFFPMADNTLYYFDENEKKWIKNSNGLLVPNRQRSIWNLPCRLQGSQTSVLYIHSNIHGLRGFPYAIYPNIGLMKASIANEKEQLLWVSTLVTVLIVCMFFGYNAYIYYVFRDKTYLYYLITQIGGILYVLSTNRYFNVFVTPRFCQFKLSPNGNIYDYELNIFLNRVSTALVLAGFVQLTRSYLDTRSLLPRQDQLLKYLLFAFVSVQVCSAFLIATGLWYVDVEATLLTNTLVVFIISAILYVAVVSYLRQYRAARYFLLANLIPLGLILALGLFFLKFPIASDSLMTQTANIAVIAQAFCLALALVERFLLIRDELKQKELETKELTHQNERMLSENLLQKIQNDLLQEKLSSNQRELASSTLYMYQKNELLSDLKTHVHTLRNAVPISAKAVIQNIESVIRNNLYLDADWERFRIHFEQVHPDFFKQLQASHPSLTKNEVRLCGYFHLNLSTKEIAGLLNIDPASVRKAKMRLNKKMHVEMADAEE